jgi:hypothetical protein
VPREAAEYRFTGDAVAVFVGGPLDGIAVTHFSGEAWGEGEFETTTGTYRRGPTQGDLYWTWTQE